MKKVAVINDISGFGRCSLTAAIPVISALGLECCPLPTAMLSNQTGYDSFYCCDCTSHMKQYINEWEKLGASFDAVLTGYLTSEAQADIVSSFIDGFVKKNTLLVVDPVMADDGKIYGTYDNNLCNKVASLAKKADIITPNLTELCILTGTDYDELTTHSGSESYIGLVAETASSLLTEKLRSVIVTGVKSENRICNVLVEKSNVFVSESEIFGGSYSGTGDLFASVICGETVKGTPLSVCVEKATRFLESSIRDTYLAKTDRNDGVNFQTYLEMLINE